MKKIFNFVRWVIGVLLITTSVGGFLDGEVLSASLVLIIGLLLVPPVWKKIRGKSSKLDSQNYTTETTATISNSSFHGSYLPEEVQNAVKQILETLNIMTTSKNIDTIQGRGEFLKGRLQYLLTASDSSRYETDVQKGLDIYKTLYYNTIVTQSQFDIITNPQDFKFEKFYINCLLVGYVRFYEDQLNVIEGLKRTDAKIRRFKNLVAKLEEVSKEIDGINDNDSINVHDELNRLESIGAEIEYKLNALA